MTGKIRIAMMAAAWTGLLMALPSCDGDQLLGPDAPQGVEGLVLSGPQCPVPPADGSCPDLPFPAWITIRDAGGSELGRVRAGEDGRFRVGLEPGLFVLDPDPGDPFPTAQDQEVEVVPGVYTEVLVLYDTGIR
jgi:hypothetical protein